MPGQLLPVFGISLLDVACHPRVERPGADGGRGGAHRPQPASRRRDARPPGAAGRLAADGLRSGARSIAAPRAGSRRGRRRRFRAARAPAPQPALVPGARAGAVAAVIAGWTFDHGGSRSAGSGPAQLLENFPVLNVESGPPPVAAANWVVEVDGLVENQLRLDRTAWLALPRTQETRDFHCVEGWSVDHLGWEGVRVADLLSRQAAGRRPVRHLPRLRRHLLGQPHTGRGAGARDLARRHARRGAAAAGSRRPAAARHPLAARLQERQVGRAPRGHRDAGRRATGRTTATIRPRRRWARAARPDLCDLRSDATAPDTRPANRDAPASVTGGRSRCRDHRGGRLHAVNRGRHRQSSPGYETDLAPRCGGPQMRAATASYSLELS